MSECQHDWNTTSQLRLVVETANDMFAGIIPMAPATFPVDFCRQCGILRVQAAQLPAIRAAEAMPSTAGKSKA